MRRFLSLLAALSLCPSLASAQGLMLRDVGEGAPGGAAPYTGDGDIVATWKVWYGLRAFSAADRGNKLVNACYTTAGTNLGCADLSSDAITGNLVPATVYLTNVCPGTNCTIKTFYDRSGNGVDATQATAGSQFGLTANCIGSLPCADGTISVSIHSASTSGSVAQSQPVSMLAVAQRSAGSIIAYALASNGSDQGLGWTASANTATLMGSYRSASITATAADGSFHALIGVLNGASPNSILTVDGSDTTGTVAGTALSNPVEIGSDGGTPFMTGYWLEGGITAGTISSGNRTSLNSNIHSYWGF